MQAAHCALQLDCGCFGSSTGESNLWLDVALAPIGRFSEDALLRRSGSEPSET